jgi:hypothetical protein
MRVVFTLSNKNSKFKRTFTVERPLSQQSRAFLAADIKDWLRL